MKIKKDSSDEFVDRKKPLSALQNLNWLCKINITNVVLTFFSLLINNQKMPLQM